MTGGMVLDASVALKLVVREDLSDHAEALLQDALTRGQPLTVPPLTFAEVTNALLQRVRRGVMTAPEASSALSAFLQLPLTQVEPEGVYEHALPFAAAHQLRSGYDTIYVVTAQSLKSVLWTADRNLINALGKVAPWVHWIGDYPLPQPENAPSAS